MATYLCNEGYRKSGEGKRWYKSTTQSNGNGASSVRGKMIGANHFHVHFLLIHSSFFHDYMLPMKTNNGKAN